MTQRTGVASLVSGLLALAILAGAGRAQACDGWFAPRSCYYVVDPCCAAAGPCSRCVVPASCCVGPVYAYRCCDPCCCDSCCSGCWYPAYRVYSVVRDAAPSGCAACRSSASQATASGVRILPR